MVESQGGRAHVTSGPRGFALPDHPLFRHGVPLLAGAVVLALTWLWGRHAASGGIGFRLDDAWIHMVYGRELAETGLLAYNRGVPATGSTSPLWAGLLGLVHLLFGGVSLKAVILGVYGLGVAFFLASIALVDALATAATGERRIGLLAALMVALSPPLAAAAFSGMEVGLCGALLLAGLLALARDRHGVAGVFLALAAVTRPEAAVVTVLAFVVVLLSPGRTGGRLARLALPSLALSGLWVAYDLWATGSPLPATFYVKSQFVPADLPGRLAVGVTALLGQVPPFWGGAAWIAALGFVWRRDRRQPLTALLPLLAGLGFCATNLALIAPIDPKAFYHLRYIMPAVPLLVVALAIGAARLTRRIPAAAKPLPAALLLACAIIGCARTLPPTSYRLHNDTRNINEVQRAMGAWISEHTPPGAWIAASDGGAVRYFSGRETIDLLGLNTPEVLRLGDEWIRERPVSVLALMPAWLHPTNRELSVAKVFETTPYTVTSFQQMAVQVIAVWPALDGREPVLVELAGVKRTAVYCLPVGAPAE
jgi:hypothetical protein